MKIYDGRHWAEAGYLVGYLEAHLGVIGETLLTGYSLVITQSSQVSFPFCLQMPQIKRDAFHEGSLLRVSLCQLLQSVLNTYLFTLVWSLHVDKGCKKGNFRNPSKGKTQRLGSLWEVG